MSETSAFHPLDLKAIQDKKFSSTVIEIVSGDCIIVGNDSLPYGDPSAEISVNFSSIKSPKLGNSQLSIGPEPYAFEAKEFLRSHIIGKQVNVEIEYTKKYTREDGRVAAGEDKWMDFGSVFLTSPIKIEFSDFETQTNMTKTISNVAELVVECGFANVVRHGNMDEHSNYYNILLAAESRAIKGKKKIHSLEEEEDESEFHGPVHSIWYRTARGTRITAIVEYVVSGHRFKLLLPKDKRKITFTLSGVRGPRRDEIYFNEAIALLRRKIMHRKVEIEVETLSENGTFYGSLWKSETNVAVMLLEYGYAKLQPSFGLDKIANAHLLESTERAAKRQKLNVWEDYVEEDVTSDLKIESKHKEVLEVMVCELLDDGSFYVQPINEDEINFIDKQIKSLNLGEAPLPGTFNPLKGDMVFAILDHDMNWQRAIVEKVVQEGVDYVVFYIDYGKQEQIPYKNLRPFDDSVSSAPGLARLCSFAYINLSPDHNSDYLSIYMLATCDEYRATIEEVENCGGKVEGVGTGPVLRVILTDIHGVQSMNAKVIENGLATVEKRRRYETMDEEAFLDELEELQEAARNGRVGIWSDRDVDTEDDEVIFFKMRKSSWEYESPDVQSQR